MKEVTKIHIAKVPYEIEVAAKKELQVYIQQLETYAADAELFNDIEIRITELLAEKGVVANGVITQLEVTAIKEQLGQPADFLDEDDERAVLQSTTTTRPRRRLYRDEDTAVVAGVVAGLASYTGINRLVARLIALVLLFGSFGTVLIIYIILWAVTPPARTAAEKLEMAGKPVTLGAIKAMGEGLTTNHLSKNVRNIIFYIIGFGFLLMAVAALLLTAVVGYGFFTHSLILPADAVAFEQTIPFIVAQGAFIVSGLLFVALSTLLGLVIMRKKWTKRIGTAVIAIIVSGLLAFSTGIGAMIYGDWSYRDAIERSRVTNQKRIGSQFGTIKSLSLQFDTTQLPVEYVVDTGAPRYELSYVKQDKPALDIAVKEGSATISLKDIQSGYAQASLRIYGPALEKLDVHGVNVTYSGAKKQAAMTVLAREYSTLTLRSDVTQLHVTADNNATINLEESTIDQLDVAKNQGFIDAGVVNQLRVTVAQACPAPAHGDKSQLNVESVTSGTISYNGTLEPAVSKKGSCGHVTIGDNEAEE